MSDNEHSAPGVTGRPKPEKTDPRHQYLEAKIKIETTISSYSHQKARKNNIPHEETMNMFLVLYMEDKLKFEENFWGKKWKKPIESNTQEEVKYENISDKYHNNWLTDWHKYTTDNDVQITDKCPNGQFVPIMQMAEDVANKQIEICGVDGDYHERLRAVARFTYYQAFKHAITHTAWKRFPDTTPKKENKQTRKNFISLYLYEFRFEEVNLKKSIIQPNDMHGVKFMVPENDIKQDYPIEYERARAAFLRMANEYYKATKADDYAHFHNREYGQIYTVGSQYLIDPNVPVPVLNSTLRGSRRWLISEEVQP